MINFDYNRNYAEINVNIVNQSNMQRQSCRTSSVLVLHLERRKTLITSQLVTYMHLSFPYRTVSPFTSLQDSKTVGDDTPCFGMRENRKGMQQISRNSYRNSVCFCRYEKLSLVRRPNFFSSAVFTKFVKP